MKELGNILVSNKTVFISKLLVCVHGALILCSMQPVQLYRVDSGVGVGI